MMKKVFILLGMVVLILAGAYYVLSFLAVRWIEPQLQKAIGPGMTVKEIRIRPTYLSVREIRYEDPPSKQKLIEVEEVRIYPSLLSFLKGSMDIKEFLIKKPSFFFFRARNGALTGPWAPVEVKEGGQKTSTEKAKEEEKSLRIRIRRIRIQEGAIDFEDHKPEGAPAQIKLREMDLSLDGIQFPIVSAQIPLELKGKLKGKTKEGDVYAKGWIDPKNMDLETLFRVRTVDVKTFEPYYRKKASAEIESGFVDMEAKITVKSRVIDAPGELEVIDFRVKEEGTIFWIPAKTLVSLLKDKGNRVKVRFHVRGNLDDPKFDIQETFLTRVAISMAESLGIPIKIVGETVFGGAKKGAGGLVEGLRSIGDIFKKKKDPGK
jgi:hypothetical protein